MSELTFPAIPVDVTAARSNDLAGRVASVGSRAEAEKVAKEFERMFIAEMLQPMFAGIETDGPFGGGAAEDMFRPMLLDRYADSVAESGGIGIADAVLKEILRMQGLE
jgi:flagellar protein FlgJ